MALAAALYVEGGIRSVEIGTLMFGERRHGAELPGPMDLVRLAIPRRVYTQSHIDYVVEVILEVWRRREKIRGLEIVPGALPSPFHRASSSPRMNLLSGTSHPRREETRGSIARPPAAASAPSASLCYNLAP